MEKRLLKKSFWSAGRKVRLTTACSRMPTARFIKVVLPAKISYDVRCLAGPASDDAERYSLPFCDTCVEILRSFDWAEGRLRSGRCLFGMILL